MTTSSFRIAAARFADTTTTGVGAELFGGRWNSRGTAMIYTAATTSLAALEMLVHLDEDGIKSDYVTVEFRFAASLVEVVPPNRLPKRWWARTGPIECHAFGDRWVREGRSAVLRVPSAIIRDEFNFLLNPAHPDFHRIHVGNPRSFRFDRRLK